MGDRRKWFPGTFENPFHQLLVGLDGLKRWPLPTVAGLMVMYGAVLWLVLPAPIVPVAAWASGVIFDAALLFALSRAKRSFGPPVPPLVVLAVMRWGVAGLLGTLLRFQPGLALLLNVLAQSCGMLLVFYGLCVEPQRLTLTHQRLESAKLPPGKTLRVLHLGDFHMERWTAREDRLVAKVRELAPDLILFSGDLLNISFTHDPTAQALAARLLNALHAPLGVFAVSGSPAVDVLEVARAIYAKTPHVRWLQNEAVVLEDWNLAILGVHCTQNPSVDGPALEQVNATLTGDPFRLLLYHTPDLAPEAAAQGMDLQLSGHTHGGQVRLPIIGALFAGSIYGKRFEMGRYRVGGMTLYVTRGIGMEGLGIPRIRLLCPPEMTVWEVGGHG